MKCMLCGEYMVCVNDYVGCGLNRNILICPKCKSGMDVTYNNDNFITHALFLRDYKFDDYELKRLDDIIDNRRI